MKRKATARRKCFQNTYLINDWYLKYTKNIYVCVCVCVCVLLDQLCLILSNPMNCGPPGSSVDCCFLLQKIFSTQRLNLSL